MDHPKYPGGISTDDPALIWKVGLQDGANHFSIKAAFPSESAADDYAAILMVRNPGVQTVILTRVENYLSSHPEVQR